MPWLFLYQWAVKLLKRFNVFLYSLLLLTSCISIPDQSERNANARKLASTHGWVETTIRTDDFLLQSYIPAELNPTKTLTIYIEGDGLAWINRSTPSLNPTPVNPLALRLAIKDSEPSAYLARPCQYVDFSQSPDCSLKYWGSHRFSAEVIRASNQGIEQLKSRFQAERLVLVGYSGGGAVAALVAAKRSDVVRLVTIAGNLDHEAWTKLHHISPLNGSLNPADAWQGLQKIPQLHLVGGGDTNVPPPIANAFSDRFPHNLRPKVKVIKDFNHACCWVEQWPALSESY